MTEISELIGSGRKQITMAEVAVEDAAPYAAADVDMTLRLMRSQEPELKKLGVRKLLDEIEMPLLPVLLDMELAGVLIDTQLFKKMSNRLAKRLAKIEEAVYESVGMPFNINSPGQLADALFGKLQLKAPGGRKTATGKVSVAADVLESMRGMHEVIDLVLEHRQLSKLKGTYLDALPELVNPKTGRVHTSFNQTGAVTGRVASQDPNLQNIPIRTELGREVRKGFIVPDGWKMIAADYSQVELRIAAHICRDPGLRAAFASGEDIHRATAATVLGVTPDKVTADQRSFAKRVNFGLLYGMGTRSLAEQAGISMKEAQNFVDAYFEGFPNIKQYIDETKRRAKDEGYVETLLGRRRYFPILKTQTRDARTNIMQRAAEREAINHPVQGSAADILKIAMIRIHQALKQKKHKARLLLQVHDELVLEAPNSEVKAVSKLVKEIMEGAYKLDPPLKVEVGVGENWDEVK
jgi:DNA polymerase-1